jgi:hypothetical protein
VCLGGCTNNGTVGVFAVGLNDPTSTTSRGTSTGKTTAVHGGAALSFGLLFANETALFGATETTMRSILFKLAMGCDMISSVGLHLRRL